MFECLIGRQFDEDIYFLNCTADI